jgi:hypothetical protein
MKTVLIIIMMIAGLVGLIWLGMQIDPRPFQPFSGETRDVIYRPLPDDLPVPVERFYRLLYGEEIPQVRTAVISGIAKLRINGITFPARYRFSHQAGKNYRHYIEATFYGVPIMKVSEKYINGVSRLELPFGVSENETKVNQAANLALWAEAIWFPPIFVTHPDVRWESVDDLTAILVVPYQDEEERFVARFDPDSGLLTMLESMRYKGADSDIKTLWINQAENWTEMDGFMIPQTGKVTWFDEGSPWAVFRVDELIINPSLEEYIHGEGP